MVLKRAYFSSYHLNSANHLLGLAATIEELHNGRDRFDFNHNSYIVTSIISSVAFLEAAINEIFQDVKDNHDNYIKPIDEDTRKIMKLTWSIIERRAILEKYQRALVFAELKPLLKGENPYRDVNLAIELRNQLVHFKPKTFGGGKTHNLADKLRGKFELNRLMSSPSNQFFPDRCLGKGCAEWVLKSCISLADEFFEKIHVTPNYQQLKEIDIHTLREKLNIKTSK